MSVLIFLDYINVHTHLLVVYYIMTTMIFLFMVKLLFELYE